MKLLIASLFFLWVVLAFSPTLPARADDSVLRVEDALNALRFAVATPLAVSPDGVFVAYTVQDPRRLETPKEQKYQSFTHTGVPTEWSATDVWVTNTQTGETKNITDAKGSAWSPAWSPDGKMLAFYSDRSGSPLLWAWDRQSRELRTLSDVIVRPFYGSEAPIWTSGGTKVLVKVLPQTLTIEKAADLILGGLPVTETQKESSGVTVHVFSSDPSAKALATTSDYGESVTNRELADLALVDVSSGAVERIATGYKPTGYWISPQGNRLAFTSLKGRRAENSQEPVFDLIIVDLSKKKVRVAAPAVSMAFGISVSWSPDGKWLSYTAVDPGSKDSGKSESAGCFLVSAEGGEARKLTQADHPDFGRAFRAPVWAPDAKSVYFLGGNALWRVAVKDGDAREVVKDPQRKLVEIVSAERSDSFWSTDGGHSMILRTRNADSEQVGFFQADLQTGKLTKLLEQDKDYGWDVSAFFDLDVATNGKIVVYIAEDAEHSADLWVAGPNFQNSHRLTHINPQLDSHKFGRSRLLDYQSADGVKLHGALLLPSNYQQGRRYPLVVQVYGGWLGSDVVNHFGLSGVGVENKQLLATRGYAVLIPDAPQHPGTPMADIAKTVIPAVNKVVDLGIADPGRIGVMGHSYGGYSTLSLIVQSKLFRAAIETAGVGNLFSMYGAMAPDGSAIGIGWAEEGQGGMGGTPWQFPERYIENSPSFHFDQIETPLLIFQGGIDDTVPPFIADEVFVDLRRLDKKVVYAKYEGERHWPGSWGYENQVDYLNRMISWFDQKLAPLDTPKR